MGAVTGVTEAGTEAVGATDSVIAGDVSVIGIEVGAATGARLFGTVATDGFGGAESVF